VQWQEKLGRRRARRHFRIPGEGGHLARRLGRLAQDIRRTARAVCQGYFVATGRTVCADVPGKMPGTAGKMPALPRNPESQPRAISALFLRRAAGAVARNGAMPGNRDARPTVQMIHDLDHFPSGGGVAAW
jgi:hypothetical protein